MKKFLSGFLALCLVTGMSIPTFAAAGTDGATLAYAGSPITVGEATTASPTFTPSDTSDYTAGTYAAELGTTNATIASDTGIVTVPANAVAGDIKVTYTYSTTQKAGAAGNITGKGTSVTVGEITGFTPADVTDGAVTLTYTASGTSWAVTGSGSGPFTSGSVSGASDTGFTIDDVTVAVTSPEDSATVTLTATAPGAATGVAQTDATVEATLTLAAKQAEVLVPSFEATAGLKEGDDNAAAGKVAGVLSCTGGTGPYTYALTTDATKGKDNDNFEIAAADLKIVTTPLTNREYKVYVAATDSKSATKDLEITFTPAKADPAKSNVTTISTFKFGEVPATVDNTAFTVKATVPFGTSLTNMQPVIVLTETKASISPASGGAQTFTDGVAVDYTVTAEDTTTTKVYKVTVTVAAKVSTDQELVDAEAAKISTITAPAKDATSLTLPTVGSGFTVAIKSSDKTGVITLDGTVTPPATAETVALVLTVTYTGKGVTADTGSINVTIPAKSEVPATEVILAAGSKGTAGNATITALTAGSYYTITTGGTTKIVIAKGTVGAAYTADPFNAEALTGTEITGLTNGTTYKVEEVKPVPTITLMTQYTSAGIALSGTTLSGNPSSGLAGLHDDVKGLFQGMANEKTTQFAVATINFKNFGGKGAKIVQTNKAMNALYGANQFPNDQKTTNASTDTSNGNDKGNHHEYAFLVVKGMPITFEVTPVVGGEKTTFALVNNVFVPTGGGSSGGSSSDNNPIIGGGTGTGGNTITSGQASASTTKAVNAAVAAAVKAGSENATATVSLKDVKTLTPAVLKSIVAAATKAAKGKDVAVATSVVISTTKAGKVVATLAIDPAKNTLSTSLKTGITVGNAPVQATFAKFFANTVAVVKFDQTGTFGMPVTASVKLDTAKLDTKTLKFYNYDSKTNAYSLVAAPAYSVSKDGFVTFTTSIGNNMIVTDKPLTLKK